MGTRTIYSETKHDFIAVDEVVARLTFGGDGKPIAIAENPADDEALRNWLRQMFKVVGSKGNAGQ